MSGTIYPSGSTFPPYWISGEGDIYGSYCIFEYGSLFLEGCVFDDYCFFIGDYCNYCEPYIIFGIGNVFGKNCTFYYCIFAWANVAGNTYIDLGSNIEGFENVLGGDPMYTVTKAHIQQTFRCDGGSALLGLLDAKTDFYNVTKNTTKNGNVSTNDKKPPGTKYGLVSEPHFGIIAFHEDGTFAYHPEQDKVGIDMFVYKACALGIDNKMMCDEAHVVLTIGGGSLDKEFFCVRKEYDTYEGPQGNSGSPADIDRDP